jgi:hypothetical protein
VIDDFQWAPVLTALERELQARNLRDHLKLLEHFKRGYERQVRRLGGMPRPPWTTEIIVELAAVFRLEPFTGYYPDAPADGRCPHCRAMLAGRDAFRVRATLADRSLHACRRCGGRWLVLAQ